MTTFGMSLCAAYYIEGHSAAAKMGWTWAKSGCFVQLKSIWAQLAQNRTCILHGQML